MRSPRRSFAAPFVVTALGAAASAGFTSCNPPAATRDTNPTGPDVVADPGAGAGSADPGTGGADGSGELADPGAVGPGHGYTQPSPPRRDGETRWTVYRSDKGCMAAVQVDCPKPATPGGQMPTCNPPPPMTVTCPEGLSFDRPVEIGQYANDKTCYLVPAEYTCPEGAICNPPPPRAVACPSR